MPVTATHQRIQR